MKFDSSKPSVKTVNLVSDLPSEEDLFSSHAHSTVAAAIAALITHEHGGRVIGLEGTWGSGKSTIVTLLKHKLEDQSKDDTSTISAEIRVAVFDAWAHQGDPLRRTFLESLLRYLVKWEWLDSKEAKGFRKRFTGKRITSTVTATPHLTLEGLLASIALLLVPLGVAAFDNRFVHYHRIIIVIGLLLAALPLLVILGFWIILGVLHYFEHCEDTKAFNFFRKDQEVETTTDSIEHGEPTSVEFEHFFRKILKASLKGGRRCVLVLDNLDRVDENDARSIFATMQTFTGSTARTADDEWSDRVWTLIPYDKKGLDHLWDLQPRDPAEEAITKVAAISNSGVADDFLAKLFAVRFLTPPIVLTDWRRYLTELLNEALPDRSPLEHRNVVRLRALYPAASPAGRVAQEEPTPRQLKQYVNSIGAILRQRSDVPLIDVAYFSLLQRDSVPLIGELTKDGAIPHGSLAYLLSNSVRENLIAIHFGTEAAIANQMLLGRSLDVALKTDNTDELTSLSNRYGFLEALDALDLSGWAQDGAVELSRAVASLSKAGLLTRDVAGDWIDDCLLKAVSLVKSWRLADTESGIGIGAVTGLVLEDSVRSALLEAIEPLKGDAQGTANSALDGLVGLVDSLTPESFSNLRVRLDVPDNQFVPALAYLRSKTDNKIAWEIIQPKATPAEVNQMVIAGTSAPNPQPAAQALEVLMARPDRFDPEVVLTGCCDFLRASEMTDGVQLQGVCSAIDMVRSDQGQSILQQLASDGSRTHQFAVAVTKDWEIAAASTSMLLLSVQLSTTEPQVSRSSAAGILKLREILSNPTTDTKIADAQSRWLIEHSSEAWALLMRQLSAGVGNEPWVSYQIRALRVDSNLVVTATEFAESFDVLRRALGEEGFRSLLGEILKEPKNRVAVTTNSQNPELAHEAVLFAFGEPGCSKAQPGISRWANHILSKASQADWESSLSVLAGGPFVQLGLIVSSLSKPPVLGGTLDNAIRSHANLLIAGQIGWTPSSEEFLKVVSLLDKDLQGVLASHLCANLEGKEGAEISDKFFEVYGAFLSGQRLFRIHEKLPNVVERLVAGDRWEALKWFVGVAQKHGDTLNRDNRGAAFDVLRRKSIERVDAEGDATPVPLTDLLKLLGGDSAKEVDNNIQPNFES
ncbi:P-loop NTPase fold protein [Acidithrix ferrooxidans]|uniref:P-loop NTPase fold protein n=1 Tax=Acidithrix ferrooxidans TaxID=1280514 RepID=UPI001364B02F|nr:P-loop NTPase fold protein [Acidithrix ferrooxidans]